MYVDLRIQKVNKAVNGQQTRFIMFINEIHIFTIPTISNIVKPTYKKGTQGYLTMCPFNDQLLFICMLILYAPFINGENQTVLCRH